MGVIGWLLEGDPAIRWQVLRDLTDVPADEVAAERARVERDGWGARLLALEDPDGRAAGGFARVGAARRSGEEYLLKRGLFRRESTGDVVRQEYLEFAFPYYWHYDVLRALDYFRRSGADPDSRMAHAIALVESKRRPDGRWPLDRIHPGRVHFDFEGEGSPSRWNTLRALRVLKWWESVA